MASEKGTTAWGGRDVSKIPSRELAASGSVSVGSGGGVADDEAKAESYPTSDDDEEEQEEEDAREEEGEEEEGEEGGRAEPCNICSRYASSLF